MYTCCDPEQLVVSKSKNLSMKRQNNDLHLLKILLMRDANKKLIVLIILIKW